MHTFMKNINGWENLVIYIFIKDNQSIMKYQEEFIETWKHIFLENLLKIKKFNKKAASDSKDFYFM